MRLAYKLLLAASLPPILVWMAGIQIARIAEDSLRDSIEARAATQVQAVHDEIDRVVLNRLSNWEAYCGSDLVHKTLAESNETFATLPDIEAHLEESDRQWRDSESKESEKLVRGVMQVPLSRGLRATLNKLNEASQHLVYGEVFLTNRYGANVAQTNKTSDFRQDDEAWWESAVDGGIYVSDVVFDDSAEIFSIELCSRIDDESNQFIGVMKAILNLEEIVSIIDAHAANLESGTRLALLTREGEIVRVGNGQAETLSDGQRYLSGVNIDRSVPFTTDSYIDEETGKQIMLACAFSRPEGVTAPLGWIVVQRYTGEELLAPIAKLRRNIKWVSVAAGFAGLIVLGMIVLPLSRRISRLTEATKAVGRGELDIRIKTRGRDEIAELGHYFNQMTGELNESASQLVQAKEKAEEASRGLGSFFRVSLDLLCIAGTDGFLKRINPAFTETLGYTEKELLETPFVEFVHPDDREATVGEIERLSSGAPVVSFENRYRHSDGHYVWIEWSAAPDETRGMIYAAARNITQRKEYEKTLDEARRAAEDASRAKGEFLANMSHEIRTPMNGILGMTEVLMSSELTLDQREHLNLVQQSAESLLRILNDILDFSKIESGKLQLDPHEFDLRDSIGDTLHALSFRATEKGLELAYHIDSEVPDCLIGDLARVRQVLVNLVGNAIKFTTEGEVVVQIGLETATRDQVFLHFEVRDTGIGISPEKQEEIFESFIQAETSTTRTYGGTGLGLAISRQLVEMMKGRIWVESEAGKGSVFQFTALFEIDELEPAGGRLPPESLSGLPVLVVDDNLTNRTILEEMLRNWEMNPSSADSGSEAIGKIADADHREAAPFRLMLLDYMMPGMDGMETARRVLEQTGDQSPRMLLLTSAGQVPGPEELKSAGIDRVVPKPVKQSDLLDAITRIFGAATREGAGVAAIESRPEEIRPMHILLAEDGRVNQMVAIKLLEDRGHSVVLAENGREAIEALEKETFDAVLMDVQMPEMNGFEATATIREGEESTVDHIPIIAMTANAMKGDREACLDAGMDDYVAKPIRSADLFLALEQFAALETPGGEVRAHSMSPPTEEIEAGPPFDGDAFREAMGGEDLMRQLIDVFAEDAGDMLEKARDALAREDTGDLESAVHAFKGLVGNYSARPAFEKTTRLLEIARSGQLDGAGPVLGDVENETEKLREALETFRKTLEA